MIALAIIAITYVVSFSLLVLVDWLSGWSISEAFGRPFPRSES